MGCLPLARVGQPVAMAAGEYPSAVEDRHAPPASRCRAKEPCPPPAVGAGRPIETHRIFLALPLPAAATLLIGQDDPVPFGPHADGRPRFAIPCPLPAEHPACDEKPIPLPAPHVQLAEIGRGFGGASSQSTPATWAAHFAPKFCRNHQANSQHSCCPRTCRFGQKPRTAWGSARFDDFSCSRHFAPLFAPHCPPRRSFSFRSMAKVRSNLRSSRGRSYAASVTDLIFLNHGVVA